MVGERHPIPILPLDPSFFKLEGAEMLFFQTLTKITDHEELRKHIIDVAAKAYAAYPYPCIRSYSFTNLKISRLSPYPSALQLARDRPGAILLDAACCLGNDLRKAVLDGWPVENTIAFDLEPAFWHYGHELFKSTPQSFPAGFVAGNAFDPDIIKPVDQPFYSPPPTARPENLQELKSLTPLQGHVSALHASSFFHLFGEEEQNELARRLASLLSPEPGSMIFGYQRGSMTKNTTNDVLGYPMVNHSPESWKELWDGQIFRAGTVRVHAELEPMNRKDIKSDIGEQLYAMIWSVTRLAAE